MKGRTRIAAYGSVLDGGMFETIDVRRGRRRTDARPVTAREQESAATLLDQSAGEPAQQEKLARIRVTDVRVAEEQPPVLYLYIAFIRKTSIIILINNSALYSTLAKFMKKIFTSY